MPYPVGAVVTTRLASDVETNANASPVDDGEIVIAGGSTVSIMVVPIDGAVVAKSATLPVNTTHNALASVSAKNSNTGSASDVAVSLYQCDIWSTCDTSVHPVVPDFRVTALLWAFAIVIMVGASSDCNVTVISPAGVPDSVETDVV